MKTKKKHYFAYLATALAVILIIGLVILGQDRQYTDLFNSAQPSQESAKEYRLIQEPQAGYTWAVTMIKSAKKSVTLTMYELTDHAIEAALVSANNHGAAVKVLLDQDYYAASVNRPAYDFLRLHKVAVKWGPSHIIVHQKTLTIDNRESAVGSGNFTPNYYSNTVDAFVVTTSQPDVSAITHTFHADWNAAPNALGQASHAGRNLIWSPNAEAIFINAIQSAKSKIRFSGEELTDWNLVNALETASQKGIHVEILMTADNLKSNVAAELTASGCRIRTYVDAASEPYIHIKQLFIDSRTAILGSQNASKTSMTYNRELSVVLSGKAVVARLGSTFDSLYEGADPY